jgi:hypothetical protein
MRDVQVGYRSDLLVDMVLKKRLDLLAERWVGDEQAADIIAALELNREEASIPVPGARRLDLLQDAHLSLRPIDAWTGYI